MIGSSLQLRDQGVDKILLKAGISSCEIFYSPVKSWFLYWALMIVVTLPIWLGLLMYKRSFFIFQRESLALLLFFLVLYTVIGLVNRSFAITDKELLAINAHFPFSRVDVFKLEDIAEIKISSNWSMKFLMIFGLGNNYVEIKTTHQQKRFYCLFLEVDAFDENWTEKTLDNLHGALKKKGISVEMEI